MESDYLALAKNVLSASTVLFAVIDVIGSIPVIISLRGRTGKINAGAATRTAFLIMIVFLFAGEGVLSLIGLDVSSFAIAGSFVIFIISLEMLLGIELFKHDMPKSASIVPLAFPILAGTGTMTTLLSLRAEYSLTVILISLVLNIGVIYIVLRNIERIEKALGDVGQSMLRRIFGVVLLAIAVKLFRTNAGV